MVVFHIATNVDMFIMGTCEPAMTIIAASIPILRHLFRREIFSSGGTSRRTADQSFNAVSLRPLRKPEGAVQIGSDVDEASILPHYKREAWR